MCKKLTGTSNQQTTETGISTSISIASNISSNYNFTPMLAAAAEKLIQSLHITIITVRILRSELF